MRAGAPVAESGRDQLEVRQAPGDRRSTGRYGCGLSAHWADCPRLVFARIPGQSSSSSAQSIWRVSTPPWRCRRKAQVGRRGTQAAVPVRSLCDGPGVHSAGGARVGIDRKPAIIGGFPSAIEPAFEDATRGITDSNLGLRGFVWVIGRVKGGRRPAERTLDAVRAGVVARTIVAVRPAGGPIWLRSSALSVTRTRRFVGSGFPHLSSLRGADTSASPLHSTRSW